MDNIVLCGFMGCGKTTVGRILAGRLGLDMADTDELCVQTEGMSIPEIFERKGEQAFRAVERDACAQAAAMSSAVISTGGGALTFESNLRLFENDTVVFLDASFDRIVQRIGGKGGRPLFEDIEKAKELFDSRRGAYQKAADITVSADGDSDSVADSVINALKRQAAKKEQK